MKCDLHVHTHYSYDSDSLPLQIVDSAVKRKIECLAVTDHDTLRGIEEVRRHAEGHSILIIPGIEVKSRKGDILGINVTEVVPSGLSVEETTKRIRGQGGIAIVAHPFAFLCPFRGKLEEFLGKIDGIEAMNASVSSIENKKSSDFASNYQLPFTAGSDAHFPEFIGRAYLEIPGEGLSLKEVLEAIRMKKGEAKGKETSFFEKVTDHVKRNIIKLNSYARGKKEKI